MSTLISVLFGYQKEMIILVSVMWCEYADEYFELKTIKNTNVRGTELALVHMGCYTGVYSLSSL